MFKGDHNQLSKVVELCKDLSATMPTMNPSVMVEETVTTTVARARVVIVREEVNSYLVTQGLRKTILFLTDPDSSIEQIFRVQDLSLIFNEY